MHVQDLGLIFLNAMTKDIAMRLEGEPPEKIVATALIACSASTALLGLCLMFVGRCGSSCFYRSTPEYCSSWTYLLVVLGMFVGDIGTVLQRLALLWLYNAGLSCFELFSSSAPTPNACAAADIVPVPRNLTNIPSSRNNFVLNWHNC